uniref:Putative tick metalloprotease n=1 Tax=Ixodes ricinus TaxID=34613 RepID=V5ID16_IXORI
MVLLKALLVLCFVAYGTSLNADLHGDAKTNSETSLIRIKRGISVGGSAQLELYILYSKGHKEHLMEKKGVLKYLSTFVKKINDIFQTQKRILDVTFKLVHASLWEPKMVHMYAEKLKTKLKKYAMKLETSWTKTHHGEPISAFLFLTTQHIINETGNSQTVAGIYGRIGGICLTGEKVAAATDDASYSGVKYAAIQLSFLMGAVYDGQRPPGNEFVKGSDGAEYCNPKDGFLMGEWDKDEKNSSMLSICTPDQHIFGLRQRGVGCFGTTQQKKKSVQKFKELTS